MHCYIKQTIQTLRVNDHRCVFLTNKQADEANDRLSTVFARSRDYPSRTYAPIRKVIVQMQKKQKTNKTNNNNKKTVQIV